MRSSYEYMNYLQVVQDFVHTLRLPILTAPRKLAQPESSNALHGLGLGQQNSGTWVNLASATTLSAINLPVALAGLLISIEPLIDMGRTALNVSGAITVGTFTSRIMGQTDLSVFNNDANLDLDAAEQAV